MLLVAMAHLLKSPVNMDHEDLLINRYLVHLNIKSLTDTEYITLNIEEKTMIAKLT